MLYKYAAQEKYMWGPILIAKRTYDVITAVKDNKFFLIHLSSQICFALLGNYISFQYKKNLMEKFGVLDDYIFKTLSAPNAADEDLQSFKESSIEIIMPLVALILVHSAKNYILSSYQKWFKRKLVDNLSSKVWQSHSSLFLNNSTEMAGIIRNLNEDIREISSGSVLLLVDWFINAQNFLLSINQLINFSSYLSFGVVRIPDLLLISISFSVVSQLISSLFTNKIAKLNETITMEVVRSNSVEANDFSNLKQIYSAGIQDYINIRHQKQRNSIALIYDQEHTLNFFYSMWVDTHSYLNMLYRNIVIGYKVFYKVLKSDHVYIAFNHLSNVDGLVYWSQRNQALIKQLEAPIIRVQKFLKTEKYINSLPVKLKFLTAPSDVLELKNVELSLFMDPAAKQSAVKKLLIISNLTFKLGQRYVISGLSGCGKSSLLAKINKTIYDGIDACGTITYPIINGSVARRVMLTQDDYFMEYSTILENMLLPANICELSLDLHEAVAIKIESILRDEVQKKAALEYIRSLLKKIKIENKASDNILMRLDEIQPNWKAILSGGQRKKLKIVWAILQKPEILLLDEVFTGLDAGSIKTIQNMLVKYLPNTMIISVDHHPSENNNLVTKPTGEVERFYQHHFKAREERLVAISNVGAGLAL